MAAETPQAPLRAGRHGEQGTHSARLGWAIHDRAQDVADAVLARLEVVGLDRRQPGPHVFEAIARTDLLAMRILGRWLATAEAITEQEGKELAALGDLVNEVCLPGLVKSYLAFRDIAVEVVKREGERLGSPPELVQQAVTVLRVSNDASLVNMTRRFDEERTRLGDELAREQAKLEHQALHDPLTGLANRVLLYERIEEATDAAARDGGAVGLIFADLDSFKAVNDSFGHESGDRLLRCVADRLIEISRPGDIVARLGGDEFVVLCEHLDRGRDQAQAFADRVLVALSYPCTIDGRDISISASVGVACTDQACEDPDTLLAHADAAMYVAKDQGGCGQAVFDSDKGHDTARRARLKFGLGKAIDRGEMAVHYQPIVDGKAEDAVIGMEALARWTHPDLGEIEPTEFVPIAEESGAIRKLDDWVLRTACAQAAQWHQGGWHVGISVNLSAHHLEAGRLEQTVKAVLDDTALSPNALTLELTESRLMADPETVVDALTRITDLGVRLAIDDFGVGYSSLAYLRRLPIDRVKIDRSFIRGLGGPGQDSSVMEAIVTLAHSLGLSVVAEGVESKSELDEVRRVGCDEIQGYLLARPAPASEVIAPPVSTAG